MLLNDSCEKGYKQERGLWERPAVSSLVPGSGEAFSMQFELNFEGSKLLRQRTEVGRSVLGHRFLGTILPPEAFGNVWKHFRLSQMGCRVGLVLLAFSGWRPEILLNILQCTGQPPPQRLSSPKYQ